MTPDGLAIENLAFAFDGRRIIDGVSLHVPAGTAYALIGSNGAGKSTLLNLCLGYLRPEHGTVSVGGTRIDQDPIESKRRLAYVPEVARLYPQYSAIENLIFFEGLMRRRRAASDCMTVLADLGLPEEAMHRASSTYSKGMRQKVSIALGMLKGAGVFLLDEPTSGLDPDGASEFRQTIRRLCRSSKAVLYTTHDVDRIHEAADIIGELRDGRIQPLERRPAAHAS